VGLRTGGYEIKIETTAVFVLGFRTKAEIRVKIKNQNWNQILVPYKNQNQIKITRLNIFEQLELKVSPKT